VIAALCAQGKSRISQIEHIERGYEDLVGGLTSLGANMKME
jgi:UDP-N-acetylglucosamine 1-carboxyvinyltransferase